MARQSDLLDQAPEPARQGFADGLAAVEAGNYRQGALRLQDAAAQAPRSAIIQHNLGVAYAHLGRTQEARAAFDRAVELEPGLADTWAQIGLLQVNARDYAGAEASLSRALELNDDQEQARLLLGNVCLMRGDTARAESYARDAVRRRPESFAALMALGDTLSRAPGAERVDEALDCFRRAARLSTPENDPGGLAHRRVGQMLLRNDKAQEAISPLRTAAARDPLDPATGYLLARAYRAAGRAEEASAATRRAQQVLRWAQEAKALYERIEQTPGDARLYFRLGAIEAARGRADAARAALQAGLARDPANGPARQQLAGIRRTPAGQP